MNGIRKLWINEQLNGGFWIMFGNVCAVVFFFWIVWMVCALGQVIALSKRDKEEKFREALLSMTESEGYL